MSLTIRSNWSGSAVQIFFGGQAQMAHVGIGLQGWVEAGGINGRYILFMQP
jgi:hypothetical protein